MIDDLKNNPNLSRLLVLAVAAHAQKNDLEIPANLAKDFGHLVRSLDRRAFRDELNQLRRLGADRYLASAGKRLVEASTSSQDK